VAYVTAVSPYYDLVSLGIAVFSQQYTLEETIVPWKPVKKTVEVFQNDMLAYLPVQDAEVLRGALSRGALHAVQPGQLSQDGYIVWRILNKGTSEEIRALFEDLSPSRRAEFNCCSPSEYLRELSAPVFIASAFDAYIPVSESFQLADALGQQAKFTPFKIFVHTVPSADLPPLELVRESLKLWNYLREILLVAT